MDRFEVIIIGMAVGGEAAAGRLLAAGKRVALIERELLGGECAYWAYIPSKMLLRGHDDRDWPARAGQRMVAVVLGAGCPVQGPCEARRAPGAVCRSRVSNQEISGFRTYTAQVVTSWSRKLFLRRRIFILWHVKIYGITGCGLPDTL